MSRSRWPIWLPTHLRCPGVRRAGGELDFYLELAPEAARDGAEVLEIGCGTVRIALRLAQAGVRVVGLDLSLSMLALAREKSGSLDGARWIEDEMRSFDQQRQFPLLLIPGHSLQHLLTAEDQLASLRCMQRHLLPGGKAVIHLDHQDYVWLGGLRGQAGGRFELAG
jgi:ubiquinone/menaquinone biosynthesis C-methylase UbiE